MAIKTPMISGSISNKDADLMRILYALILSGGVVEGMQVTTGQISTGYGFCLVTRTGGHTFPLMVEITSVTALDTSGTKKVWIEFDQTRIDDPLLVNSTMTNVATVATGASYPVYPHVKLASIASGTITDEREELVLRGLTRKGRTPWQLRYTDGNGDEQSIDLGTATEVLTSGGATQPPEFTPPSTDINSLTEVTKVETKDFFLLYRASIPGNRKVSATQIFENTEFPIAEDVSQGDVLYEDIQSTLNPVSTDVTNAVFGTSWTNSTSRTAFIGEKCFAKEDIFIRQVTSGGAFINGRARITYAGVNYDATLTSGTATFTTPVFIPRGGVFLCQVDNNGATFNTQATQTLPAYPYQTTLISWMCAVDNGNNVGSANRYNINSIVATRAQGINSSVSVGRNANTQRQGFDAWGTGIASTTVVLPLSKVGAPGQSCLLRIETDNAGAPSGTLFHANATATVVVGSISTMPGLITFTLGGSITIPKGQKVWFVVAQNTYAVDASNYYVLRVNKIITRRNLLAYDGTVRAMTKQTGGSALSDPHAVALNNYTTGTPSSGALLFAKRDIVINSVSTGEHGGGVAPNRMHIANASGTILYTQAITIGSNAILTHALSTPYYVKAGTFFQILFDRTGASYAGRGYAINAVIPKTNIDYINGVYNNAPANWMGWLQNINTTELEYGRPVANTSLVYPTRVAKASAKQFETLPINRVMYARDNAVAGEVVNISTKGKVTLSGLTDGAMYYLSDSFGAVGLVTGTIRFLLGKCIGGNLLNLNAMLADGIVVTIPDLSVGVPCWYNDTNVPARISITGGTITAISIVTVGGVSFQIATTTNQYLTLNPGEGVQITSSAQPTMRVFYLVG